MTRRDLIVALITASLTLGAVAATSARSAVLSSQVFDWNAMTAKPNKTGAVRTVVQAPTATLDELEIHITTLRPGETPHPPHKHPDEELLVVKEGTVESLVNGELNRLGPGPITFHPPTHLPTIRPS